MGVATNEWTTIRARSRWADLGDRSRQARARRNATLNPNVTIRNNRFHDYPNVRLSGRGRYLVENNRFEHGGTAVVGMDLAEYWYESGRISEMTIRNNTIVNGGGFSFGLSGWNGSEADVPKIHGHHYARGQHLPERLRCRVVRGGRAHVHW